MRQPPKFRPSLEGLECRDVPSAFRPGMLLPPHPLPPAGFHVPVRVLHQPPPPQPNHLPPSNPAFHLPPLVNPVWHLGTPPNPMTHSLF
jgi:hypothetical protein